MSDLTVGIIGGGFMARTHATAARAAGVRIAGLVSSSSESTLEAASALDVEAVGSVAELVDRADVVHVCSPNAVHAEHVRIALAAGKNVVCEKPLAVDAAEADALLEEALAAGVVTAVPFVYRFHPMVRQARALVQAGEIGRLLTIRGTYLQDWMLDAGAQNWRVNPKNAGRSRAFGDIGSHLVDLVEFVSGERIVRLSGRMSIAHAERAGQPVMTEDTAALVVETASGASGSLMVSQVTAGRKNALNLELGGATASLAFDQEHPDELWLGGPSVNRTLSRDAEVLFPDAARLSTVPAGHPMGYLDAFTGFLRDTYAAVRGEHNPGLPTFADGARANRLIDAMVTSSSEDRWVDTAN